jgi:uncharacterized protein YndB with AHSA1/START domain
MSITSLDKDYDNLQVSIVLDFAHPVEQVWQLWADPRRLERWWGPPAYPATVEQHDLTPGGTVTYFMTGPEGDTHHGYWNVSSVDEGKALTVVDGFAHDDGTPNPDLPTTTMSVAMYEHQGGTRVELTSAFDTREQMDELVAMGMIEGVQEAAAQMDGILAA